MIRDLTYIVTYGLRPKIAMTSEEMPLDKKYALAARYLLDDLFDINFVNAAELIHCQTLAATGHVGFINAHLQDTLLLEDPKARLLNWALQVYFICENNGVYRTPPPVELLWIVGKKPRLRKVIAAFYDAKDTYHRAKEIDHKLYQWLHSEPGGVARKQVFTALTLLTTELN